MNPLHCPMGTPYIYAHNRHATGRHEATLA